jgi:CheY-like chemotaxis protein
MRTVNVAPRPRPAPAAWILAGHRLQGSPAGRDLHYAETGPSQRVHFAKRLASLSSTTRTWWEPACIARSIVHVHLAVRRHQPDVVLLDVHLPDINGMEVCRLIKADAETRHVKVVQVSASVRAPLDQLHCLEEGGADMYLDRTDVARHAALDDRSPAEGQQCPPSRPDSRLPTPDSRLPTPD